MSKNAALLAKINDTTFWTGENAEDTTKLQDALDALLQANPENEQEFEAAIKSHESTWGVFEESQAEGVTAPMFGWALSFFGALFSVLGLWKKPDNESLDAEEDVEEDVEEDENVVEEEENPSSLVIQQAAVAQRVKLSLNKTNDQEILLKILKYNEDECRAYLAEKVESSITKAYGWKETTTPDPLIDGTQPDNINDSKEVLTDGYINNDIKKMAAARWVLQVVDNANFEALTKLDTAKQESNLGAFREAVKELGFPEKALNFIDMDIVYDLAQDKIQERRTLLETAKKQEAAQWVLSAVDNASLEVLTTLDTAKQEGNLEAFRNTVKGLGFTDDSKFIDMDTVYAVAETKIQERRTVLQEEQAQLEAVKKQEAEQWVVNNVDNASLEVLNKLDLAKKANDENAFRNAVKELGFTGDSNLIDMDTVYGLTETKIQERRTVLQEEQAQLEAVKKQEAEQWVVNNVDNASLEVLNKLDLAKKANDENAFRNAVKELGFTGDSNLIDMDTVYGLTETKIQERRGILQVQSDLLMAQEAMTTYESYIAELSDDEVFAQGNALLDKEGEQFRAALVVKDNRDKLTVDNLTALREKLGARYLNVALARDNYSRLLPAMQKEELAEFNAELGKLFPGHTYIAQVVTTQEQMVELKHIMAAHAVPNLHQAINNVIQSAVGSNAFKREIAQLKTFDQKEGMTLQQFRAELAKIVGEEDKAALSYLTKNDMLKLQDTARMRRLDVQIGVYSIYGVNRHSRLREAFRTLSVGQQRDFLDRSADSENNPDLRHILRSTELSVLTKYLHVADELLQKIQEENINNQLVKSIHNSQVIKCLLSISPPIILTESQVADINKNFIGVASFADGIDNSKYIALVHAIKIQASISEAQKGLFYLAFGLEEDGSVVKDVKIKNNIEEQHKRNLELLNIAAKAPDKQIISPRLISFLLRVNKGNGDITHLKMQTESEIQEKIQMAFRESRSAKDFIDLYIRGDNSLIAEQYKKELTRELTPKLYREIKNDIRIQTFKIAPELINKELNEVEKNLAGFKRNHKQIGKYAKSVDYIPKMNDVQIYNPEFQSEPEPKKIKYEAILAECEVNREQLLYDRRRLKDYLDSIPVPAKSTSVAQQELKARIEELHSGIQAQIDDIDKQVAFFAEAKDKIKNAILPSLNREHSKKWTYNPHTVVTYLVGREQEKSEAKRARAASDDPYGEDIQIETELGNPQDDKQERITRFVFENQPNASQVRCFDVTYKTKHTTSQEEIKIQGRFIYDKSANEAGKSNKSEPGKYIVRQFPTAKPGDGISPEALDAARVNFAMAMATQVLAGMDGPPTRENPIRLRKGSAEELQYLWTAFAILGEKVPKMKFGTDAIFVVSTKFDPASQKGFWGYAEGSLYKESFAKNNEVVKEFIDDAREYVSKRHDKKGVKSREKSGEKATEFFKKQLHATRVETEERQKEEGLAAEPSEASSVVPRTGG